MAGQRRDYVAEFMLFAFWIADNSQDAHHIGEASKNHIEIVFCLFIGFNVSLMTFNFPI